jgi:hypothetical protein
MSPSPVPVSVGLSTQSRAIYEVKFQGFQKSVTWLTWARPRLLHLGSAQLRHDTAAVGDPVEGVVVAGAQHLVGGLDVGLQAAKAEVDSPSERGEESSGPSATA